VSDVEDLLRQSFARRELDVDLPMDVGQLVTRRGQRERRRARVLVGSAAAAVLVVAVMAAVTVSPSRPATLDQGAEEPPGPVVPTGTQPVSFHGLQLFVPAAWTLQHTRCGTPLTDTAVVRDGSPVATCFLNEPSGLTVAELHPLDSPDGKVLDARAREPLSVDGHAARRGEGTAFGRSVEVLSVPDVGVVVEARSPDLALRHRIVASARVVPVDSLGCLDHVAPLAPSGQSDHEGAAEALVPGSPVSASVCRYSGSWLMRSLALPDSRLTGLVQLMNSLPATQPPTPDSDPACQ
jgi:hypothetical protein